MTVCYGILQYIIVDYIMGFIYPKLSADLGGVSVDGKKTPSRKKRGTGVSGLSWRLGAHFIPFLSQTKENKNLQE